MASSKGVLCKFFMQGACLKGEYCEFSHNWKDTPNNICTFYQKGMCTYGNRCRYDHIKLSRTPTPVASPQPVRRIASPSTSTPPLSNPIETFTTPKPTWSNEQALPTPTQTGFNALESINPYDYPICSFAAAGSCPYGATCPHMHGDTCPICEKQCLHPFRPDEREEHMKLCNINNKRIDALKKSKEIECCVCLERVLSKGTAAERKFGLLSECDHPFCVSCIRNWRSNQMDSGIDVYQAVRACPICRKLSYYVIPSVIWYFSKDEKDEIVGSYKAKLKSIDCKYFDFGKSKCPFGTSCFYKHAYADGSLEEVKLRHVDSGDGSSVIVKINRLPGRCASLNFNQNDLTEGWQESAYLNNSKVKMKKKK